MTHGARVTNEFDTRPDTLPIRAPTGAAGNDERPRPRLRHTGCAPADRQGSPANHAPHVANHPHHPAGSPSCAIAKRRRRRSASSWTNGSPCSPTGDARSGRHRDPIRPRSPPPSTSSSPSLARSWSPSTRRPGHARGMTRTHRRVGFLGMRRDDVPATRDRDLREPCRTTCRAASARAGPDAGHQPHHGHRHQLPLRRAAQGRHLRVHPCSRSGGASDARGRDRRSR